MPSERLRPSSVDREHGPVDVAGLGRRQERDRRGDLVWPAGTAGRHLGWCPRASSSASGWPVRAARPASTSRRRWVSVAPGATQLTVTPAAAYSSDSSLAAAVTPARSTTDMARSGCGWRTAVEVTNTSRPKPRDGHARQRQAGQPQRPEQQQLGAGPPGVVSDVEDPAGRRAARVEDQHVRLAVPGRHRVQRARRVRRGDVADQGADRGRPSPPAAGPPPPRAARRAAGDDDAVGGRQTLGDRVADAGSAAADQRGPTVMVASQGSCLYLLGLA